MKASLLRAIVFAVFLLAAFGPPGLRAEADSAGTAPSWNCGDWWVVEQSKEDISKPEAEWLEPVQWRCEVTCPEGENLMVLEIRSLSGLETGVDVVFTKDPWAVKLLRKYIARADGIHVLEQEVVSNGPVMDLDSPFALVLPGFPLADTASSMRLGPGSGDVPRSPGDFGPTISDSSRKRAGLRWQYQLEQKVSAPAADDRILAAGERAVATLRGGTAAGLLERAHRVEIRQGGTVSVQLWSPGLPWALVEEAPHSKTHLVEYR